MDYCNMLGTIVLHFSVTLESDSCVVLYPVYVHKLLKNSEEELQGGRDCSISLPTHMKAAYSHQQRPKEWTWG